jgi:rhodanese-related sulfurtransferase
MVVPRITKEDLKQRLDAADPDGAPLIVDARLKYPFEHSAVKLPGAIRMHPNAPDPARLPLDRDIVIYDSDPDELAAEQLALALLKRGYRRVSVLKGGIADWMAAKLPVESKPYPRPLATAGAKP